MKNILKILIIILIIYILFYIIFNKRTMSNNDIDNQSLNTIKDNFNMIYSNNNILEKYPEICNIIFNLSTIKNINFITHKDIIDILEKFISNYESCILDKSLANKLYSNCLIYKLKIIDLLNNFTSSHYNIHYNIKVKNIMDKLNDILDNYLNDILLINNKYLLANGYNKNTILCIKNTVLPYNTYNNLIDF
jgi:hypothetical protein